MTTGITIRGRQLSGNNVTVEILGVLLSQDALTNNNIMDPNVWLHAS